MIVISVKVDELSTRLAERALYILYICNFSYFPFFVPMTMIVQVPGHCLLFYFNQPHAFTNLSLYPHDCMISISLLTVEKFLLSV